MRSLKRSTLIPLAAVSCAVLAAVVVIAPDRHVDFNTQIRPILNSKCLNCHGGVRQRSDLSFLFRDDALIPAKSGSRAIVPGKPGSSELITRINHWDPEERMPPDEPPLQKTDRRLIASWIKQGAPWDKHWAYVPVSDVVPPPNDHLEWGTNGIDRYILNGLRLEGLSPSNEADRSVLARRVSLDLTGLPPAPERVEAFMHDEGPDAYESFVDELLNSPHFGERWAAVWLDLSRYADSQGYQKDLLRREVWRYRDWVIDAFNRDLSFDQFTIEQLAGDLLPEPTENQLLATFFHRNTMTNDEGGTDNEEFRVAAVIDRLNTTFEVWQGTTIACVQCHHHPYDPIRHREFYELSAFFNTTADSDYSDDRPTAKLMSPAQSARRDTLKRSLNKYRAAGDTLSSAYRRQLRAFLDIQPGAVPVMRELPADSSRQTVIFEKGNWLVHGDTVQADVPGFLPALPDDYPRNRLGLAKWLVDGSNPLTARVMVNRFWAQLFGEGIVTTLGDFGTQGASPTHPELLDWMSTQFADSLDWSVKGLLKLMVMSSTYRQSSDVTDALLAKDPENKLYARASRFRLSAEQVRDQALAVSGLLNRRVYGESVMPYQPDGVWNVIRHAAKWSNDTTDGAHRRAIYTFWRRVSPYPSMVTFDAPSRELCVSSRIRTNTPLQALVTLNDPVYVEAAQALASRMREEGGAQIADQIVFGFRAALMRHPDDQRLRELRSFFDEALATYQSDPESAQLITGMTKGTASVLKVAEMAALVNVAGIILNLDELIMRT